jgi:2,5-diketo-D-gluconate reductase A
MPAIPAIKLNDGNTIPQLGFGVFRVPDDQAETVVAEAVKAGYRAIDTAAYYRNEAGTGNAIARCGIPREELHITTKVWHTDLGFDATLRAFDDSLAKLRLDYLDLYLIHWPAPSKDNYVNTWRAMETLRRDDRVRSIGVSNFNSEHLDRLLSETGTVPAVNQIELHPNLPQRQLREFDNRHEILTQAWSPLGHGKLLTEPEALSTVSTVAKRHDKTPAQVLLRWNLELGNAVVSKSVTPQRMRENSEIFDFQLDKKDHAQLATLDNGVRTGPDPAHYGN